ncbi:probable carboxylesterase 12 [Andrographis paniculata]|uniref:probable carboxylesterase 12 n=1 Tax=Andrographis paniculata TaxID=175694 RepID=UPI0021E8C6CD|nr:probable carboxylesterase 12 [Andrographis paniculata]
MLRHKFLQFAFLHLISVISAAQINFSDILYDVSPFIIVYKNGTVSRLLGTAVVPPSPNPAAAAGVRSKDIRIDPRRNIAARLFLPETAAAGGKKLPLLVYFHGGAFVTESAFSPTYHNYLSSVAREANIVVVSVNYRLAPENPLPIGYDDSWRALEWAFGKGGRAEPWLRDHVDFNKVYIGGDSAGGNIAHNMAIRAGLDKTGRVSIAGMFLNCPHFWGNKPIGERGDEFRVELMKKIWLVAYPNSPNGFDNPDSNPGLDPNLSKLGCKRVLVYVAEKDVLRARGLYYVKKLRASGWKGDARVVDVKGEGHVFNLLAPNTTKAKAMMDDVASFFNGGHAL